MDAPHPKQADEPAPRGERAGVYLAALAAFAVPILIVSAIILTQTNVPEPVEALEPATRSGLDRLEIEASELTIEESTEPSAPATNEGDPVGTEATNASSTAQDEQSGDSSEQAQPLDAVESPSLAAGDIDVAVYNQAADEPGTYSFAIRLTSKPETSEIDTAALVISVVNNTGEPVPSISRFEHETLPPDSSALALVRAEQVRTEAHYVVVSVGGTELDRAAIEAAA